MYTRTQAHRTYARNQSDSDAEDLVSATSIQIENGFSLIDLMVKRHGVISTAISRIALITTVGMRKIVYVIFEQL